MIDGLLNIVDKFIPNKDKAAELEAKIQEAHSKALTKAVEADKDIKLAELKKGGIAAVWRPLAAISVFATLALHHLVLPSCKIAVNLFNLNVYLPQLEPLPIEYYGLAISFVSIYAYGRSLEKRG